ncbi:MAG: SPOR domain-containing protein [Nitrospirae bacterium]|nr:SPOR domain-containing protein [Nitrospirota bacterium]
MKDLDNITDSVEKKSSGIRLGRWILILVLCFGLAGTALFLWKKITSAKKELRKEMLQIPVAKLNPEPDLTFYKNLKNKSENAGKKESIVPLIPPTTAPHPKTTSQEEAPRLSPRFTLQVASMKDHQKAVYLQERLKRKGFPSYIISAEIPDKGTYYRVRIGHYMTKKAAEEVLTQLKSKGEKEGMIAKENVMTKVN